MISIINPAEGGKHDLLSVLVCLCAQGRFPFLNAPTIPMEVKPRMPNAKVLSEKQAIVAELTEKIQKAKEKEEKQRHHNLVGFFNYLTHSRIDVLV